MGITLRVDSLTNSRAVEEWNTLRDRSLTKSPFNHPAFVRAVWDAHGLDPVVVFLSDDRTLIAACILAETRRGPFIEVGLPPFVPVTPILVTTLPRQTDINQHRSFVDSLEEYLRKTYDRVRIHLPPDFDDPRSFSWNGWEVTPLFTPIGDFPASADPSTWSKGSAQLIDKHSADYEIQSGSEYIGEVVELVGASYNRNSRHLPSSTEKMTRMLGVLVSEGLATPFIAHAERSGLAEAGVIALHDFPHSCYWLAGSSRGPAMTVLLGTMLPNLAQDGFKSIDFVGANTASIAEFKRHFNTRLKTYYACSTTPSKTLRIVETVRS